MAKKDRTGNRKTRDQRKQFKVPELGYYLIVTDTEATERCFFTGLHQALPEDVRNKLVIKVVETKTRAMIDKCLELTAYDAQYRIPWINSLLTMRNIVFLGLCLIETKCKDLMRL